MDGEPERRRRGGRRRHGRPDVYAALDLGTNNCRLLVARPAREGFRVVDAFSRIVRLGEGVRANGLLSEAAILRTIEALKVCAGKMERRGVRRARHVATEACRQAGNCDEFLARVEAETGIALEIIDSEEEARLAFTGCAPLLDLSRPHGVMFDIGGGSTEVIWVACDGDGAARIVESESLPCGVTDLSERYGGRDIARETYETMVAEVMDRLGAIDRRHAIAARAAEGAVQMVGTSGTVTTLAGIHMDLPRYNRALIDGCRLTFDEAVGAAERLLAMSYETRCNHPCIGPDRADMVIAGTAIFDAIRRLWPVGDLRVADRGLREGILLGLMAGRGA
ncbi:MAG: Ppx/GppA family phosphatase [Rhodospirillaceae bacterium]|nr:Ppx/GppA family phosphatase [Rhodospirillaceae bacterium]